MYHVGQNEEDEKTLLVISDMRFDGLSNSASERKRPLNNPVTDENYDYATMKEVRWSAKLTSFRSNKIDWNSIFLKKL